MDRIPPIVQNEVSDLNEQQLRYVVGYLWAVMRNLGGLERANEELWDAAKSAQQNVK